MRPFPLAQNGNPHLVDFPGLLAQYGTTSGAVASSEQSQGRRFEQFVKVLPDQGSISMLDVGCGYGALVPYVLARRPGLDVVQYVGLDIFPEMLRAAERVVEGAGLPAGRVAFHQVTDQNDPLAPFWTPDREPEYDYVYVSGVLTYAWSHASGFRLLTRAYQLCRVALVANCLSTWAPVETASNLHYRPGAVVDCAGRLSRWIRVDHTYLPHDCTVTIWRDRPTWPI